MLSVWKYLCCCPSASCRQSYINPSVFPFCIWNDFTCFLFTQYGHSDAQLWYKPVVFCLSSFRSASPALWRRCWRVSARGATSPTSATAFTPTWTRRMWAPLSKLCTNTLNRWSSKCRHSVCISPKLLLMKNKRWIILFYWKRNPQPEI